MLYIQIIVSSPTSTQRPLEKHEETLYALACLQKITRDMSDIDEQWSLYWKQLTPMGELVREGGGMEAMSLDKAEEELNAIKKRDSGCGTRWSQVDPTSYTHHRRPHKEVIQLLQSHASSAGTGWVVHHNAPLGVKVELGEN